MKMMIKFIRRLGIDNKGYTLLEIMLVLIIISLLVMIAFSGFSVYIKKAKNEVYKANCLQLERMYNIYLLTESAEDSEESFNKFMQEHKEMSQPSMGVIDYRDGDIYYSLNYENDSENNISNDNDFNENDDNESYINENIVNEYENDNNDESIENDNENNNINNNENKDEDENIEDDNIDTVEFEDIYNENIENDNNSNEDANNESDANEKEICNNNCLALEEGYNYYLMENSLEHTEILFIQYMQSFQSEICPSMGVITYTDGKVRCSLHSEEDDDEDNNASFL